MRLIPILIVLFCCYEAQCQDTTVYFVLNENNHGIMPMFQGGEEKMSQKILVNLEYPQEAKAMGIQGKVYVTFVVEKDGSMSNEQVFMGIGGGCDEEALRVVRMLDGKWSPGTIDGKPVRFLYTIPIRFTLDKSSVNNSSVAYNKGVDLMNMEKYKKAMSYFLIYQPGDRYYPDAMNALGLCRFLTNDYKGAIAEWEKAKAAGHKDCKLKLAETYLKVGNQYKDEKEYLAAISCYDKALDNSKNDINVLYNRGITYLLLGMKEKACTDWQKIKDLGSAESQQYLDEYCK